MAQMLSTFSKVEQSRFEAFQRSRLASEHVADWTAACLSHCWNLTTPRALQDLVAVGQAPEITLVVSVLAKIYAQRVVQTAVKMRQQQQSTMESSTSSSTTNTNTPLTVNQLRAAWQERQNQGLDPGFFLQAADERCSATRHHHGMFATARLAALEAQEKYDTWIKEQQQQQAAAAQDEETKPNEGDQAKPADKSNDDMEI